MLVCFLWCASERQLSVLRLRRRSRWLLASPSGSAGLYGDGEGWRFPWAVGSFFCLVCKHKLMSLFNWCRRKSYLKQFSKQSHITSIMQQIQLAVEAATTAGTEACLLAYYYCLGHLLPHISYLWCVSQSITTSATRESLCTTSVTLKSKSSVCLIGIWCDKQTQGSE